MRAARADGPAGDHRVAVGADVRRDRPRHRRLPHERRPRADGRAGEPGDRLGGQRPRLSLRAGVDHEHHVRRTPKSRSPRSAAGSSSTSSSIRPNVGMHLDVRGGVRRRLRATSRSARSTSRSPAYMTVGVAGHDFDIHLDSPNVQHHRLQRRARRRPGRDRRPALARHRDGPDARLGDREVRRADAQQARSRASTRPRRSTCSARWSTSTSRPARIDVSSRRRGRRARHLAARARRLGAPASFTSTTRSPRWTLSTASSSRSPTTPRTSCSRSLWAAKGLDKTIDLKNGSYGEVGKLYDRSRSRPRCRRSSTRAATGSVLTVGDLMATFKNGGAVATQVAINAQVDLKVVDGPGRRAAASMSARRRRTSTSSTRTSTARTSCRTRSSRRSPRSRCPASSRSARARSARSRCRRVGGVACRTSRSPSRPATSSSTARCSSYTWPPVAGVPHDERATRSTGLSSFTCSVLRRLVQRRRLRRLRDGAHSGRLLRRRSGTPNAGQVRVTPTALAEISANPARAARRRSRGGAMNGVIEFHAPANCGGSTPICCPAATRCSELRPDRHRSQQAARRSAAPRAHAAAGRARRLDVTVRARIKTEMDIPVTIPIGRRLRRQPRHDARLAPPTSRSTTQIAFTQDGTAGTTKIRRHGQPRQRSRPTTST